MNDYGQQNATLFEKKAAEQQKIIAEYTQVVNNGEELTALIEAVKQQGGLVVSTQPIQGKQGLTVTFRILKD